MLQVVVNLRSDRDAGGTEGSPTTLPVLRSVWVRSRRSISPESTRECDSSRFSYEEDESGTGMDTHSGRPKTPDSSSARTSSRVAASRRAGSPAARIYAQPLHCQELS